jgi:hypothetical protein
VLVLWEMMVVVVIIGDVSGSVGDGYGPKIY